MISPQFCSLSATYIRNQIVNALRNATDARVRGSISLVSPNIVFEHPTLQLLAAWIAHLVERGISQGLGLDTKRRRVSMMNAMLEKYSVGLSRFAALPVVNGMMSGRFHIPPVQSCYSPDPLVVSGRFCSRNSWKIRGWRGCMRATGILVTLDRRTTEFGVCRQGPAQHNPTIARKGLFLRNFSWTRPQLSARDMGKRNMFVNG